MSSVTHPNTTMRFDGVIKSWNDERGFGFIEPTQGGQEIFVHIKAFPRGAARPLVGLRVSFEMEAGPPGRKRARNVAPGRPVRSGARARSRSPARRGTATLFAIPAFFAVYLVTALLWQPPLSFALVYLAASMVTFMAYAFDKSSAERGAWRTSEGALHTLSLIGGWPGALVAQQVLRHKSSKAEFRSAFWATVLMNVGGFVLLCSPFGRPLWSSA